LEKAARYGVPSQALDHKAYASREDFDAALVAALRPAAPDLICLAGYMRIITPVFLKAYGGRILNIHPALLPKHGGPGMYGHHVHEAVLEAGDQESGATVHWVTEEVDGGAVILQERVPVLAGDSNRSPGGPRFGRRALAYPEALRRVCLGQA